MKIKIITTILTLVFSNISLAQTLDFLQDFEPGKRIVFSFTRDGYPPSIVSPEETFDFFSGSIEVSTDSITFSQIDSVRKFYLVINKKGTESFKTSKLQTISERNIDTVYFRTINEFTTENYGAGTHRLNGWIIPDTVQATPLCPNEIDSTIYYKYPYYFRHYTLPTTDTLDFHLDTLTLSDRWTDCLDIGYQSIFKITTKEGLISFYSRLFNWFGWSEVERYKKIEVTKLISLNNKIHYSYFLYPNYPNPFNTSTTIKYQLAKPGFVKLEIFDLLGRKVKVLVDRYETCGLHQVSFDASNFSNGMYIYSLRTGEFSQSRKLLLLK